MFINTLVLRTDTSGDPSFSELLERVREMNLAAYENQDVPFERLVEELNPVRSRSRHPLFQVMLAFQNTPDPVLSLPEMETSLQISSVGASKFDLTLELAERRHDDGTPAGIEGLLEFSTDLFKKETAEALAGRLLLLLEDAAADPDKPIGSLTILSDEERRKLLPVKRTAQHIQPQQTLPELFEIQAAEKPDETAASI